MADSKITALTAISTVDPTADPLVIVDVSDTSMAASGTTKKSTINQLLGAGGTATLASATITGDLTVRTTGLVVNATGTGVQVSPSAPLCVKTRNSDSVGLRVLQSTSGTSGIQFTDDPVTADWGSILATSANLFVRSNSLLQLQTGGATERLAISSTGVCTWSNVGGVAGTAMTLNANGLGVGDTATVSRLQVRGSTSDSTSHVFYGRNSGGNVIMFMRNDGRFVVGSGTVDNLIVTETGNVGIGVTPSYKLDTYTTLSGTVSEKRFANRTSNKIIVKRYFSITADTALFSIECGTAGANNMAAFEINVFATGTKAGSSSDRQFYGKFYVTRNLAGTFTITSAFSSGSAGAFNVAASGTSLNVSGIFSVISDGSACVEITGYIGGRDTIAETNFTVTMP